MTPKEALIATAESQVGYKASKGKINKYAEELDKIGTVYNFPKNGYDWCDIFVDWCFITTFGYKTAIQMIYQPEKDTGAGCPYSAQFYRDHNAFKNTPSLGSQIFFGSKGKETHTGIVISYTDNKVYTVEGNTGGGDGGVNKRSYYRTDKNISGYGRPNWDLAITPSKKKTNQEIAEEVLQGKWGNGQTRKDKLKKAGYDPEAVQKIVNLLYSDSHLYDAVARQVIDGLWSSGEKRKEMLTKAGYDYEKVQAVVNKILGGNK